MSKDFVRVNQIEDVLSSLDLLTLVLPLTRKHPIGSGRSSPPTADFKALWFVHLQARLAWVGWMRRL